MSGGLNSGTTDIAVTLKMSPDGDAECSKTHSTPITATTVSSEPQLLTGYADTDTNGPIGEWLHPAIIVGPTSNWAVVEVFEVRKPT